MLTVQCYIKVHTKQQHQVVAVCDESCLGKKIKGDDFSYDVSENFFNGQLVSVEDALKILQRSGNFNAVGKNVINGLIQLGVIHESGSVVIDDIPIALKFGF